MGSSKKHKEKDRDRDRKRKKRHRSHSGSRGRDRKRHHRINPEDGERRRDRERDRDRDRHTEITDDFGPPPVADNLDTGKEHLTLSIEETNKLRAKLGLKPLEVGTGSSSVTNEDGSKKTENNDVHVPAVNIGEKKRSEKIREKMKVLKEKREIQSKLKVVKGLGDTDSEDESASAWVKKNRIQSKEKQLAEKRAKLLEEMDEEFGIGSLVEQEFQGVKAKSKYTPQDLSGLKVEHSLEKFRENEKVILTLKDKGVLDEEEDDVLINVNIVDDERAEKNVENKKKKPDYKPYDEPQFDEYGMLKPTEVLDKYDEEIHGAKKESFVLGSGGKYDAEQERNMERIRQELRQQGQSLMGQSLTIASEYFTPEEMSVKFKKVKKRVRKIRKKEILKADDLLPLPDQMAEALDYGSRSRGRGYAAPEITADDADESESKANPFLLDQDACFYTDIIVKKEPFEMTALAPPVPAKIENDDIIGPDEDLSTVAVEEDEVRQELQSMLNKTRRLMQTKDRKISTQKVLESLIKSEDNGDQVKQPAIGTKDSNIQNQLGSNIILNSTSEFCRNLGEIPTYGLAGNREEEREEIMDLELELMEQRKQEMEQEEQASGWNEVDIDTNPVNITGEERSVLEEEPIVSISTGAALQLAMKKGYLESQTTKKMAGASKSSHIQAQNYSIEDKRYDDLDEKYRKRDRYQGGMVTDFKDKDGYHPEIRLEYVDESGRMLNPKEAFRQLSHRFHGKGSGKRKTEKRQKKVEEEQLMKQMSSTDTPLNTLSLLKEKQRVEKSPFVILSGNKSFSSLSKSH